MKILTTFVRNHDTKNKTIYYAGENCKLKDWKESETRSGFKIEITAESGETFWIDGGLVIPHTIIEKIKAMTSQDKKKYLDNTVNGDKYNI